MTLITKRITGVFAALVLLTGTAYADSYLVWGSAAWSKKNSNAVTAAGGTIVKQFPQIGMVVVESDNPEFMSSISGVAGVVPDFQVSAPQVATFAADDLPQPPNSGNDDPLFDLQWGHTSVRAQEAWAAGQTGAGVRVFVLDEGFDLTHPDLTPNYNLGLSTSFVPGEDTDASYLLADPFSHGTHVSGTIAAADNAFGTIGVAPDAELVPVKVLSEILGYGQFSWIIEGILYAADNGADVINMSLGTIIPQNLKDEDGNSEASEIAALRVAVNRAIAYAYQSGATVVVSAGNNGLDLNAPENAALINFNGFASHAVSISAVGPEGWGVDPTTDLNQQAYYTNVGPEVNFAGQGGTVDFDLLASGQSCTVAGLTRPCYVFDFVFSTGSLNSWYWSIGTSMAAPHAAGVAAIIIGENGGSMHPAQVKAEMAQRALDLGKPGKDDLFGAGLVTTGY
jgi:subtilisin family serine protease